MKVPALKASAQPQPFPSNREAVQFTAGVKLPAAHTFYDRALRCSLGFLDVLAAPEDRPTPKRIAGAADKREALAAGSRIPRAYSL